MYKNGYDMVMLNLNSKLEMKIFIAIRDSFSRSKIEINISQVKLAEKFNTTKSTVNGFIKKLVEIGFLIKIERGIYRMNPFIYVPYQADAPFLQAEWTELTRKDGLNFRRNFFITDIHHTYKLIGVMNVGFNIFIN